MVAKKNTQAQEKILAQAQAKIEAKIEAENEEQVAAPSGITSLKEFGHELKSLRERKNIQIETISEQTRIREVYIQAMEAGRFGDLPGVVYQRMYIKSYADAVGQKPDALLQEFDRVLNPEPEAEVAGKKTKKPAVKKAKSSEGVVALDSKISGKAGVEKPFRPIDTPDKIRDKSSPSTKVLWFSIVMALLIGGYVYWHNNHQKILATVEEIKTGKSSETDVVEEKKLASAEIDTSKAAPTIQELVLVAAADTSLKVLLGEEVIADHPDLKNGETVFISYQPDLIIQAAKPESIQLFVSDIWIANASDFKQKDGAILLAHDAVIAKLQAPLKLPAELPTQPAEGSANAEGGSVAKASAKPASMSPSSAPTATSR